MNMLWLDSSYPLDRPDTDPGVKRGGCPGGETSTPEYLRATHPDGYVIFKNVALGEIGSTLQTAPLNPAPTPAPQGPTEDGCWSNNYKDCNHPDIAKSCDTTFITGGPRSDCIALWGECTGLGSSDCCGDATCHGDSMYAQCVTSTTNPSPTPDPIVPPTPSPLAPTSAPMAPTPAPMAPTPSPIVSTPSPVLPPTPTPVQPTPSPMEPSSPSCCTWGGWSTCPSWTQNSSDACQQTQAGCTNCSGQWISP